MPFKCDHCGQCCENTTTQIAVTLGDVQRLCQFLGKSAKELIPEYISINPFGHPDSEKYELDLGLNIPCRFRIGNRCAVYKARPLNCRLFPAWIIANAPLKDISLIIDKENRCSRKKYTMLDKKRAREYVKAINAFFERENKITEKFVPAKVVRLRDLPGHEIINGLCSKLKNERDQERIRIQFLKQQIKQDRAVLMAIETAVKFTKYSKLPETKPF